MIRVHSDKNVAKRNESLKWQDMLAGRLLLERGLHYHHHFLHCGLHNSVVEVQSVLCMPINSYP